MWEEEMFLTLLITEKKHFIIVIDMNMFSLAAWLVISQFLSLIVIQNENCAGAEVRDEIMTEKQATQANRPQKRQTGDRMDK